MKAYSSYTVIDVVDGMQWQDDAASHPENPKEGWAYYNTEHKCSYIYDGEQWVVFAKDGQTGPQGPTGPEGNGISEETPQYCQSSSSSTAPTSGWYDTFPTNWDKNKQYVWQRTKQVWTQKDEGGAFITKYTAPQLMSQLDVATKMAQNEGITLDKWCVDNDVTVISGAQIATGTITADHITINDLGAFEATIGGWKITESGIESISSKVFLQSVDRFRSPSLITSNLLSPVRFAAGNQEEEWIMPDYTFTTTMAAGESTATLTIEDSDSGIVKVMSVWISEVSSGEVGDFSVASKVKNGKIEVEIKKKDDEALTYDVSFSLMAQYYRYKKSKFTVLDDGSLYASAAQIKGNVTIGSGAIGAWEVETSGVLRSSYYNDTWDLDWGIGLDAREETFDSNGTVLAIGRLDSDSWDNARFRVMADGSLFARDATVDGFTTYRGTIGAWNLNMVDIPTSGSASISKYALYSNEIKGGSRTYQVYLTAEGVYVAGRDSTGAGYYASKTWLDICGG
jgi:hypothetical protein